MSRKATGRARAMRPTAIVTTKMPRSWKSTNLRPRSFGRFMIVTLPARALRRLLGISIVWVRPRVRADDFIPSSSAPFLKAKSISGR